MCCQDLVKIDQSGHTGGGPSVVDDGAKDCGRLDDYDYDDHRVSKN